MALQPDAIRRLTEAEAERLLSRAAELDARTDTSLSVEQLRTIAEEAGIRSQAFEQALQDIALGDRLSDHVPGRARSVSTALAAHLFAVGSFWLAALLLLELCDIAGAGWELRALAKVTALGVGAAVAHRMHAPLARLVFLGFAGAAAAAGLANLIFGLGTVQDGPAYLAVLGAGLFGAGAVAIVARWPSRLRRPPPSSPRPTDPALLEGISAGDDLSPPTLRAWWHGLFLSNRAV